MVFFILFLKAYDFFLFFSAFFVTRAISTADAVISAIRASPRGAFFFGGGEFIFAKKCAQLARKMFV